MSGKVVLDSGMQYRREDVSMAGQAGDGSGTGEYQILRTSEKKVRQAKAVLEELESSQLLMA